MSKPSTSWTFSPKEAATISQQLLLIGDGYNLLIDGTYDLEIQSESQGTTWNFNSKPSTSWTFN